MKKIIQIILLLVAFNVSGQSLKTPPWKLGLNFGWLNQQADINNKSGFGVGAHLEYTMFEGDKSPIALGIRGRGLTGIMFGKDRADASINEMINNPVVNNYVNATPKYKFNNRTSLKSEWSLEAVQELIN